ncbi:hypothetical protein FGIG_10887 [Fasciola gigantica]|uniref:Uncharacterized protein n=1 Tax=Fasciola gigantica TaxID=46835 RepID=A0A504X3L2_FASGI|nr:hypothetical protein FGIG_10887 [Fasciola gigantica]
MSRDYSEVGGSRAPPRSFSTMNIYAMSSSSSLLGGPTSHTGPSGEVVDPTTCGILSGFAPSELRSILSDRSDVGGVVATSRLPNPHQFEEPPRLGLSAGVTSGSAAIPGPSARRLMHLQSHHQQQQQEHQEHQQHTNTRLNESSRASAIVAQGHSINQRQRGPDVHNGTISRSTPDARSDTSMIMDPQRLINSLSPNAATNHQRASSDLNGDPRSFNTATLLPCPSSGAANPNPNPVTSFARNIRDMLLGRSSSGQVSTGSRSASYRRIARSRWHHSTGSILVSTASASRSEDNVAAPNGGRSTQDASRSVANSGSASKSQRFRVPSRRSQLSYTPPPTTVASESETERIAASSLPPQLNRPIDLTQSHDRLSLELRPDLVSPTRLREFGGFNRSRPRPRSASSSTSKLAGFWSALISGNTLISKQTSTGSHQFCHSS